MMKGVEFALVSAMAVAVLAFGGTEPVSYALVEMVLFAAAIGLAATSEVWRLAESPRLLVICGGLVAVVLSQFVSGARAGQWLESIAPSETHTHFLSFVASLAALLLTVSVCQQSGARRRVVYALLAIGGFEAVYGLVQYLTGWQQIFTYVKIYNLDSATGTYINENHFAGLLEMIVPFALALGLSQFESLGKLQRTGGQHLRRLLGRMELPKIFFGLTAGAVMLLALFFSFSRMGILAADCSILCVLAITANLWQSRRASVALAVLFALAAGGLVIWVGPGPVLTRFTALGREAAMNGESRVAIWRDAAALVRQHPWLGTGLGTFPIAYTSMQTAFLGQFVNHAHNDYLELASDVGIPAAVVLFGAILYVPLRTLRRLRGIRRPFDRAIAIAATGSVAAILLHSLADFNLYIPANAMVLCVILGLAISVYPQETALAGAAS